MSRPRRSGLRPLASINVTPLVDVMLVLLIIFMVTATLDRQGIPVSLPTAAAPLAAEVPVSVSVTINKNHELYFNDAPVGQDELLARLKAVDEQSSVFFRADKEVPYGSFVEVVALIRASGIEHLMIETAPPSLNRP